MWTPNSPWTNSLGVCYRADCSNIPSEGLAVAPWDEGTTVWPLPSVRRKPDGSWQAGIHATSRERYIRTIIQHVVPRGAARCLSADQTVYTRRVDIGTTVVGMGTAKVDT